MSEPTEREQMEKAIQYNMRQIETIKKNSDRMINRHERIIAAIEANIAAMPPTTTDATDAREESEND